MFLSGRISGKNKKATGDNLVVGIVHDGYPCRLAREVATRKGRQNKGSSPLVSLDCDILGNGYDRRYTAWLCYLRCLYTPIIL